MVWGQLTDYDLKEYVRKDDYADAYSVLIANTAEEPASLAIGTNTILGRLTGNVAALTATQVAGLINHNELTGLQGGTTDEYYHLTAAQYSALPGSLNVTTDTTYNNFGSNPATIAVDNSEGQGDLRFNMSNSTSIIFDVSGLAVTTDGVRFQNGADYWNMYRGGADKLNIQAQLGNFDITVSDASGSIQLEANKSSKLEATAGTLSLIGAWGVNLSADNDSSFIVDGGDLEFQTTTSGAISLNSVDNLTFKDQYLSAAIGISESGTTSLSGYTAISIVGALNEVMAAIGVSTDLDEAYNNFGSNPATVLVDNAEGQGSLQFTLSGTNDFIIDISACSAPNGAYNGFLVNNGSDSFEVVFNATNEIEVEANVEIFDINTVTYTLDCVGGAFSIDSDTNSNISVNGADLTLSTITSGDVLISASSSMDLITTSGDITLNANGNAIIDETVTIAQSTTNLSYFKVVKPNAYAVSGYLITDASSNDTVWMKDGGSAANVVGLYSGYGRNLEIKTELNSAINLSLQGSTIKFVDADTPYNTLMTIDGTSVEFTQGDITTPTDVDLDIITAGTGVVKIGSGTPGSLNGTGDLYVASDLEIDGTVYIDNVAYVGNLYASSDSYYGSVSGNGGRFMSLNTEQTNDGMFLLTGTLSNHIVITEIGDKSYDRQFAQSTNPTLYGTSANQTTDEYWSITHNQSSAIFTSGKGTVLFDDEYLSAAIGISQSGTTGLSGFTATSIIGALNELKTITNINGGNWKIFYTDGSGNIQELTNGTSGYVFKSNGATAAPSWQANGGTSETLDQVYDNGAATITVDAYDVLWNLTGAYSHVVDLSSVTGTADGLQVNDGTDYFRLLHKGANLLDLDAVLQTVSIVSSGNITLNAQNWGISWNSTDLQVDIDSGGHVTNHGSPVSLSDDASFDLPNASAGFGFLIVGDGEEFAQFTWTSAGVVTLINNSGTVVNSDTDTKFCIFDNGTAVRIRNRLGAAKEVVFDYHYTTP